MSMMVKIYLYKRQTRFNLNNEVAIGLLCVNNFNMLRYVKNTLRCLSYLCISFADLAVFLFFKITGLILNFRSCLIDSYTSSLSVSNGGDV